MGWREAPGEPVVYKGICWFPYPPPPPPPVYSTLTSFLNFILPLLIISGIYVKIYLIVCERNEALVHGQLASVEENNNYLGNLKAAKTMSTFVGVFFCCWAPYSMYIILISLCDSCFDIIPEEANVLFLMFGYLNSALNPFLFALRNKSFKATLLYSTLLYSTLLYSTLLCSTLLYSTLLYSTLLYSTLLYSTLLYSTLLCSALLYSTLLYSALLYSTLLCSTLLCSSLPYPTLLYSTQLHSTF